MNRVTELACLGLLVVASGCGKSTADIVQQTHDPDPNNRRRALQQLEERRDRDVLVPALIEALRDADAYVRRDAARALARVGAAAPEAVTPLLPLLKDKEPSVRKAAGEALKQIEGEAATPGGVR